MRAVVRRSGKAEDYALLDVPKPSAGPGQLLLKVAYGGICSSDAHVFGIEMPVGPRLVPPVVAGHEGVGYVEEVGSGVTGYAVGDLVAAETTFTCCGVCPYCRSGKTGMCRNGRRSLGWSANGYWAEHILVNAQFSHKLAPHVDPKGAAVLEPFTCGVNAVVHRSRIGVGDVVVVFGPGPIGMGGQMMAQAVGARTVMVGTPHSKHRLELARQLGAERTLVDGEDDVVQAIKDMTGGYGAHACILGAASQRAFDEALACVRRLGQVVLEASPRGRLVLENPDLVGRQIDIIGAEGTSPASWDLAVDLLSRNVVTLGPLVSDVFPLEQWREAIARTASHEGMKVLLQP